MPLNGAEAAEREDSPRLIAGGDILLVADLSGTSAITSAMGAMSIWHWLIVLGVILLLFGPSRLAGAGKGLGEGIRNFKKGLDEDKDALPKDDVPPAPPTQLTPPHDSQKP